MDVCSLCLKNTSSKYHAMGKEKALKYKILRPLVSIYGRHVINIECRKIFT